MIYAFMINESKY